jgi:homospermidine synthase
MKNKIVFRGKFVLLGFGSVASSLMPLLFDTFELKGEDLTIISVDEKNKHIADFYGAKINIMSLNQGNYKEILAKFLKNGDFLINLSVDVSSIDLIEFCSEIGALYLDTCIEPWPGFYTNANLSLAERSNFAIRKQAMELKNRLPKASKTALVCHGMNPGTVSHFVKQALINMAKDAGIDAEPKSQNDWGKLAKQLEVKVIHIAERDSQISNIPKKMDEFCNTWSVDGLLSEGSQPAEMGWGSHEKEMPKGGIKPSAEAPSIILSSPGMNTKVKTWLPLSGECESFVITHNEAISISHYFSTEENGEIYRPTCHYTYRPCNDTIVSMQEYNDRNFVKHPKQRILTDEIVEGFDELGVLIMGGKKAYWYGSLLDIHTARKIAPFNTATSLQIASGVLAGIVWTIENPEKGIVEAEDMDYKQALEVAKPYLGRVEGFYTDFNPLNNRQNLFEEDLDLSCPLQFKNFRI